MSHSAGPVASGATSGTTVLNEALLGRMEHLWNLSHSSVSTCGSLSRFYMTQFLRLASMHNVFVPDGALSQICTFCGNVFIAGKNATIKFVPANWRQEKKRIRHRQRGSRQGHEKHGLQMHCRVCGRYSEMKFEVPRHLLHPNKGSSAAVLVVPRSKNVENLSRSAVQKQVLHSSDATSPNTTAVQKKSTFIQRQPAQAIQQRKPTAATAATAAAAAAAPAPPGGKLGKFLSSLGLPQPSGAKR